MYVGNRYTYSSYYYIIFTLNMIVLTRRIKILIHNQSDKLNDK